MNRQRATPRNWPALLSFGIAGFVIAWFGLALSGSPIVAAVVALIMTLATFAALRPGNRWLRAVGLSVFLLAFAFFAYAAVVFYLNYG